MSGYTFEGRPVCGNAIGVTGLRCLGDPGHAGSCPVAPSAATDATAPTGGK